METTKTNKDAIIVGIDFGTTYSGVAWCLTSDPDNIRIIRSWQGNGEVQHKNRNLEKVPTVIVYGSKDTTRCKWGFEATAETESQNCLRWFKLLLNTYNSQGTSNALERAGRSIEGTGYAGNDGRREQLDDLLDTIDAWPEGKTPLQVTTDYLKGIYEHTRATFEKSYPKTFTDTIGTAKNPLEFVLTVPAVWTDDAKELTLKAARAAGLDESHARIKLVSEPEAAAIHCLETFKETNNSLQVGDVYVIADCGGGTVDLISYEIVKVEPRLRVKECVVGTGDLCGSTQLNRNFLKLVKERIGQSVWDKMNNVARSNTLRHFDEYIKPNHCPADNSTKLDDDEFDLETHHCPVPGVPDDPVAGIFGGHLALGGDDMETIFSSTFARITELVQAQVTAAENKSGRRVTGVLLVGGFGSSPYLHKHLSMTITAKTGEFVKILQPVDAWTAIVRGAVAYGVSTRKEGSKAAGSPIVESRIARFSYGVSAAEPFIAGEHPANKMRFDIRSGDLWCPDRMQWFVEKGKEIPDGKPIEVELRRRCPTGATREELIFKEEILCCELDKPPLDATDPAVRKLLVFTADLNDIPRKKHFVRRKAVRTETPYWEIPFFMVMKYQSASLEFSSQIGGKALGKGSVEYNHEPPRVPALELAGGGLSDLW
ncbi:hypothetical protein BDZ91DRAFT_786649 [Kalaharituber pfeilii]|nr:hypothetical protein BDZ91DRAFT_786649 [Kalaharituber pfeilii]